MSEQELTERFLPCPFCGSNPRLTVIKNGAGVALMIRCITCKVWMRRSVDRELVKAWNKWV